MEIRKNANLVSHIFPLEGALFGVLFSFCKRNEIAAALIVIRSSDYVFANTTQIRGSIPGEDNFVMAWKA